MAGCDALVGRTVVPALEALSPQHGGCSDDWVSLSSNHPRIKSANFFIRTKQERFQNRPLWPLDSPSSEARGRELDDL